MRSNYGANPIHRPVCRAHNAPLRELSLLLNTHLTRLHEQYRQQYPERVYLVRDSLEAVSRLLSIKRPKMSHGEKIWFIMLDVKQLYPSMRWDKIEEKVRTIAELVQYEEAQIRELLVSMERCILESNYMLVETREGWSLIQQKEGSITGSHHAVAEANLYMQHSEHLLHEKVPQRLLDYLRYVDDDFAILVGTRQHAEEFVTVMREGHGEELELTAEISDKKGIFLDIEVTVSKDPSRFLETAPYRKPLKRKEVNLHWDSTLPRSVFFAVYRSQIIRFLRLTSTKAVFQRWKTRFTEGLKRQGWGARQVNKMAAKSPTWQQREQYMNRREKAAQESPSRREKVNQENPRRFVPVTFSKDPQLRELSTKFFDLCRRHGPTSPEVCRANAAQTRLKTLLKQRYAVCERGGVALRVEGNNCKI